MKNKNIIKFNLFFLLLFLMLSFSNVEARATSDSENSAATGQGCSVGVKSGTCEYKTADATDSSLNMVGTYSDGVLQWKDINYKDEHGLDHKETYVTRTTNIGTFFKTSSDVLNCPSVLYLNVESGGNSRSSVYSTLSIEKASQKKTYESKIYLVKSNLTCDDTVKEETNIYTFNCGNDGVYSIIKYSDGSWGVKGSGNISYSGINDDLAKSSAVYLLINNNFNGQKSFSKTSMDYANKMGYRQTLCSSDSKAYDKDPTDNSSEKGNNDDSDDYKKVNQDCEGLIGGGDFIKWVQWAFNLIKIIGPVLALVLGMVDFIKAAASGEDDAKKKATKDVKNRLIAAALLFFVPSIIQLILSLVPGLTGNPTCGIK